LIIEHTINEIGKYTFIPGTVGGLGFLQILCLYGTLKTLPEFGENPAISVFFILCCINLTMSTLLNNTLASKVYVNSCELLKSWKNQCSVSDKLYSRELKGFPPTKITFAERFMDKSTPLVFQDFIIGQSISLLLLR